MSALHTRSSSARRRAFALGATALALLGAHCSASPQPELLPTDEPMTGTAAQAISQAGVERTIPIAFYILSGPAGGYVNPANASDVQAGLDLANSTWASTGVQFTTERIVTKQLQYLWQLNDFTTKLSWSQVLADAQAIDPSIPSNAFPATNTATVAFWLKQIGGKLSHSTVRLFVGNQLDGSNCWSSMPGDLTTNPDQASIFTGTFPLDNSHAILCAPVGTVGGKIGALAHELGHHVGGLYHTFDIPTGGANAEGDLPEESYDLLYDASIGGINSFKTRAAAQNAIAAGHSIGKLDQQTCVSSNATCNTQCSYPVVGTLTASANGSQLYGLTFDPGNASENYGVNVMSYQVSSPATPCTMHFSQSQVEIIKKRLHDSLGDRNLLGSATSRGPSVVGDWSHQVDFDGDGKRDLAVYRRSTSQCIVRLATGAVKTISMAGYAQVGDEPIAADFDGDNKTDCGLIRRNFTAHTSSWVWSSSVTGVVRTVTMEPNSDNDVPMPGLRMSLLGGTSLVSYNPATAIISYQVTSSTAPYANVFPTWKTISTGTYGDIITGKFDGDVLTDFVWWRAGSTLAALWSSTNGYASGAPLAVPAGSQVALRGVNKNLNSYNDLAFYAPSTGVWSYIIDPGFPASMFTLSQQWGAPGDVPMGGFDVDGDGRSDELVYRNSGDAGGQGQFLGLNSSGGVTTVVGGSANDLPFATVDEDGDYKAEFWIFRGSGQWWLRSPSASGHAWSIVSQWGMFTDSVF